VRRIARVDANQSAVVAALRQIGASVEPIHMLGRGVPDLLVGYMGSNLLLEVKDGDKPPSARKLTSDERAWHDAWNGTIKIVNSPDEAVDFVLSVIPF
jgi:hypothetical protein